MGKSLHRVKHGIKNVLFSKFFFGFISSLSVLISSHDKAGRIKDNLDSKFNEQEDTFDFIIVGGGTAGSLIANRLSEQHKVLLLEAGGEAHPLQKIPGMAFFMLNHKETDWMHRTVPQRRACFSSPHRRASWSQGLNLGGTSNLGFLSHLRGSPRDYDAWAKATGDDSWSYDALLPYFRRHESYQGDSPDREAHGFDGELKLEAPAYTGMAKEFIRAGQELGYEHVDLNARYDEGFDTIYYPLEGGERKSSSAAFLDPIRGRESLIIRKYAHVNKILIRSHDTTAYGVEYDRHGRSRSAYATKEIILAAGTVESAKLLLLSGVGPRTHLTDLGIPLVADLPVGKNLQDHLTAFLGPFYIDPPKSYLIDRDITIKSFYEYKSDGTGPLSTSLFQAAAAISSKRNKWAGQWNWPDILFLFSGLAGHSTFPGDMAHAFHLHRKGVRKYFDHGLGRDSFFIAVSAARPYGRGELVLEKKDPYAPPSINPRYLENEHDLGIMIEGIKTALYLVENTTSFQNLRARFTAKKWPGCEHKAFRSDDYFECYVRHFAVSMGDFVGSCGMGHPHMGKEGVVDNELQVLGVKGLRVVDGSVMPSIVGAPTEAAVLMIAEKGADLIMESWRRKGGQPQGDGGGEEETGFIPHKLKDLNGGNYRPWDGVQDEVPTTNNQDGPPLNYGPPPNNQNGPPPNYGPPPNIQNGPPPNIQNGPPPNYGPPPNIQNGPPPNYGPPPNIQNGPPSNYGPPPNNQNGPPNYGRPNHPNFLSSNHPNNGPHPNFPLGPPSNFGPPPNNYNGPQGPSQSNHINPPPNFGWYNNPPPPFNNVNGIRPPPPFNSNSNNGPMNYYPPSVSEVPPQFNGSFMSPPQPPMMAMSPRNPPPPPSSVNEILNTATESTASASTTEYEKMTTESSTNIPIPNRVETKTLSSTPQRCLLGSLT